MSGDILAAEIAKHWPWPCTHPRHGAMCMQCSEGWPCLVRRLADERARYRQVLIDTRRQDGHWYGCWTTMDDTSRCSPECLAFAVALGAEQWHPSGRGDA